MQDGFSWWALLLLTCVASGCEANAKPERSKSTGDSRPILAWKPQAPPPYIVVSAAAQHASAVSISIANHDTTTHSLSSSFQIQRQSNGQWHHQQTLELRKDCTSKVERCMELAPGAEVFPPAFAQGMCGCKRCSGLIKGIYRVVVQTCDGKHNLSGNELPL